MSKSKIVSMEEYKQRKEEEEEDEFFQYMDELYRKSEEIFRKRYGKIFAGAPDIPAARIKYFCGILLMLVPYVAEGDWEHRCFAHDDFCRICGDGVDETLQDWCRYDPEMEQIERSVMMEYCVNLKVTRHNMRLLLTDAIKEIISIAPEVSDTEKKEFVRKLYKLFEICRRIMDIFMDELEKRQEAGTDWIDYDKLESWVPEFVQELE